MECVLPEKISLCDRGGTAVCWLPREEARRLLAAGEVELLRGRRGRVLGVRWTQPEAPDDGRLYVVRKPGYGDPHQRETWDNPAGVWTIDRVRRAHRRLFLSVVAERLAA